MVQRMLADADLSAVAALIGDHHRARFLLALLGGDELAAGELAQRADASTSLASSHLGKLLDGGLVAAERRGRNRYYRIASADVADAIERLLALAPERTATGLKDVRRGEALRQARTCYDHFAGRLGVGLTDALERQRVIRAGDDGWELTGAGVRRLGALGVDVEPLRSRRRPLTRRCLDWTERRPHLAGTLGAAIAQRLLELDWLSRIPGTRALRVTPEGQRRLLSEFALEL
jgi:DNA-binding transcriptional ArsR family regulator